MTTKIEKRSGHLVEGAVRANSTDDLVTFPVSSETPYRRYEGDEILIHTASACDLSWLNSGNAPLMDNHDTYSGMNRQIGVIVSAELRSRRLYITVRFSSRPEAQAIRDDVLNDIVRNVSIGYKVMKVERNEDADEYRVTKWMPTEASFVPVPADMTVGMGRSAQLMEARMPKDTIDAPGGDKTRMPGLPTAEERAEAFENALNDIRALSSEHNIADIGEAYIAGQIRNGHMPSIEVFRGIARSNIPEGTPLRNENIGLTGEETRSFSIMRLAAAMRDGAQRSDVEAASFEIEACEAAAAKAERAGKGQYRMPAELMDSWNDFTIDGVRSTSIRADGLVSVGNVGGTGATPQIQDTDFLAARFIDNLRNALVLGRLGITMLPGLSGDVDIPGGDQNSQAFWLGSEDADAAETRPTFRKVSLAPKDIAAYTDITRRMLQQSAIAIEAYVRRQLVTAMAEGIDLSGFYGSGLNGEPEGLAETTGIGSVTFAGAVPTRDELIDMDTAIANTNRIGTPSFVTNTAMAGNLRKTKVDAGSGVFLLNSMGQLEIGNPLVRTNQIVTGDIFAGAWADYLMGMWGSLELDRSTEAKFLSGGLRLRVIQSVDFQVARVGSFVLGNDTV